MKPQTSIKKHQNEYYKLSKKVLFDHLTFYQDEITFIFDELASRAWKTEPSDPVTESENESFAQKLEEPFEEKYLHMEFSTPAILSMRSNAFTEVSPNILVSEESRVLWS